MVPVIHSAIPSMMTGTGGEERCQVSGELLFANILHARGAERKTVLSEGREGVVTVRGW